MVRVGRVHVGAAMKQEGDGVRVTSLDGLVDRGGAIVVLRVDPAAEIEKSHAARGVVLEW